MSASAASKNSVRIKIIDNNYEDLLVPDPPAAGGAHELVQKVNFETTSDLKKDFGHLYEHSPTGSEDLLQFENEDEEEIKRLK
jgi:hypothetical protein